MKCPYVFPDGRVCTDEEGHEEYALNCGHLPAPYPPDEPVVRPVGRPLGRKTPLVVAIAAMAMLSMGIEDAPRVVRADPKPPPPVPPDPDGPPPIPTKIQANSRYGRVGTQPLPRAFYSSRLMPGEDPSEMGSLLAQAEKRTSDQKALAAAEEKRARKARKRLGK